MTSHPENGENKPTNNPSKSFFENIFRLYFYPVTAIDTYFLSRYDVDIVEQSF